MRWRIWSCLHNSHTKIGTNLVNFTIAISLNMENNDPCGIGDKIIWAAHAKVK